MNHYNKNTAMIARLLIGWGLKTYMASGSMILYVKKKKNALQHNAKNYSLGNEEMKPVQKNAALRMNNASA